VLGLDFLLTALMFRTDYSGRDRDALFGVVDSVTGSWTL